MNTKDTIDKLYKLNLKLTKNNKKFSNQSNAMLQGIKESLIMIHEHKCTTRNDFEELLQKISGALTLSITKSINYGTDFDPNNR
jgi:two-component sensor histidine kinase